MRLLYLVLGASLAACGGKAVIDPEPTGTGTNTSSGTTNPAGGGSTGGTIESIELGQALAYANCFPPGESLDVELTLTFTNSGEPATIDFVEGRLTGPPGITRFPLSPGTVVVGAMATQAVELVSEGDGLGTGACDWCDSVSTAIEVEMLVDGKPRIFSDEIDSVSCSF